MLYDLFYKIPIIVSFIGGVATFVSPCILPVIPSYMSYMSGVSLAESLNTPKVYMLKSALMFVLGFGSVFFILGLAMMNIFHNIFAYEYVRYISGAIVIMFGLHFLGLFRFGFLYKSKQFLNLSLEKYRYFKSVAPFIFGVGFAAGWTPCTGPIITSIGMLASVNKAMGVLSLLSFIVGLSLPFIFLAAFIDRGLRAMRILRKYMRFIEIFSALFLILVGVLIILGEIENLVGYIQYGIGG